MSDSKEISIVNAVCQLVEHQEFVPMAIQLFHLAGKMTGQEVEVHVTNIPEVAGIATYNESFNRYKNRQLNVEEAIDIDCIDLGAETRDNLSKIIRSIEAATPFADAGFALVNTSLGATAIIVNVDDPTAFRRELDAFYDLVEPQQT